MNVDDGISGRMARAPAVFAKGHVVAPAQIIYLKVLGNAVIGKVPAADFIRFQGGSLAGPLGPRPILHFREVAVLL
jgi:hypothetical protein